MQKIGMQSIAKAISMAFLAVVIQSAAHAAGTGDDKVEIYGYGHQGYLQATDNTYLGAGTNGTWDYNALALVFAKKIDDKTRVWTQIHTTSNEIRLDWVFVDFQVNNNLVTRVGQIKQPFGLYNEIRDIKFLHLSTLTQALYSEAAEIAHEAYRGAAVVYDHDFGGGSLSWDAYLGEVAENNLLVTTKNRGLAGGRVTYKTPVDGLIFMASAYNNKLDDTVNLKQGAMEVWMLSADYTNNNVSLKSEYVNKDNNLEGKISKSYYAQAGYTFAEKWTPFVRYDYITTDQTQRTDPSYYQKTTSLGVGYKINHSVKLIIENNWNNGYALPVASTLPEMPAPEVAAGAGKTDWNMFAASVSFIF